MSVNGMPQFLRAAILIGALLPLTIALTHTAPPKAPRELARRFPVSVLVVYTQYAPKSAGNRTPAPYSVGLAQMDENGEIVGKRLLPPLVPRSIAAHIGGLQLSPDGRFIATLYEEEAGERLIYDLCRIDALSGRLTRLTQGFGIQYAKWSPDSKRIAVLDAQAAWGKRRPLPRLQVIDPFTAKATPIDADVLTVYWVGKDALFYEKLLPPQGTNGNVSEPENERKFAFLATRSGDGAYISHPLSAKMQDKVMGRSYRLATELWQKENHERYHFGITLYEQILPLPTKDIAFVTTSYLRPTNVDWMSETLFGCQYIKNGRLIRTVEPQEKSPPLYTFWSRDRRWAVARAQDGGTKRLHYLTAMDGATGESRRIPIPEALQDNWADAIETPAGFRLR